MDFNDNQLLFVFRKLNKKKNDLEKNFDIFLYDFQTKEKKAIEIEDGTI